MSDEKPPERIWVENLNANWRHQYNCTLEPPTKDDHRILYEYVRKDIADRYIKGITETNEDLMISEMKLKLKLHKNTKHIADDAIEDAVILQQQVHALEDRLNVIRRLYAKNNPQTEISHTFWQALKTALEEK